MSIAPDERASLVIFDCDGVLVDSEVLACAVDAEVYTAAGYPMSPADVMRRFVGMSAADIRATIERDLGRSLAHDFDAAKGERLFASFRRELRATLGIHDVLDRLAAAAVPVCVASSSSPARLELALGLTDLAHRVMPHVFSATMVARGKPAPDLFLLAAARMGVPPARCLVIEDSVTGVVAAKAAGMRAIGFCGGSHCGPDHTEKLRAAGAEREFASMAALGDYLARVCVGTPVRQAAETRVKAV